MIDAHRQLGHRVRFEWGPTGAEAIGAGADLAVVVDVLSFTTTLTEVVPVQGEDGAFSRG